MMDDSLSALLRLIPRGHSRAAPDGYEVGGTRISGEILEFLRAYGGGCFDGFLWILEPDSANKHLDITRATLEGRSALVQLAEPETQSLLTSRGLQVEDLVVWAVSDNGDLCYWAETRKGALVLVNEGRSPMWCAFEGGVADFVLGLLTRTAVCDVFPKDFPAGLVPDFSKDRY